MAETKEEIAADRDRLQEELYAARMETENLRGQLAAAGAGRPGTQPPAQHRFVLSEGQRQEFLMNGNVLVDGEYLDESGLRTKMGDGGAGVELVAPEVVREVPAAVTRDKIAGIDYIYPSVEYGKLDPAVAGTPGVSGPAADAPRDASA